MQRERTLAIGAGRFTVTGSHESLGACEAVHDDGPAVGSESRERHRRIWTGRIGGDGPRERRASRLQASRCRLLPAELDKGVIEGGNDCRVAWGVRESIAIEICRATPVATRGAAFSGEKTSRKLIFADCEIDRGIC